MTARVLIIAGSDSGGGAGIQADIKTVTMLGGHAMTAITAITAQNTLGVSAVHPVPADMVLAQIDAVIDDIGIDAVKIGMIGNAQIAEMVAGRLSRLDRIPIVFDPVMVATSGAELADEATIAAFERLMDVATIVTPNIPELAELSWGDDEVGAALRLVSTHRCAVLLKGGHIPGPVVADALIEEDNITSWQGSRIETRDTHGTGCTLSTAIATFLAQGAGLPEAVARAREFVRIALLEAPGLGGGHGPMGQQQVRLDAGPSLRLNQVTVGTEDYDASVAFYRALGLKLIVDSAPDYARFETAGGATLSIHRDAPPEEDEEPAGIGITTIYFECNDLDAETLRLGKLGLRFEHGPIDQPWLWREARLKDPFGNTVCLYRAGEARRFPPWRVR